MAWLDLAPLWPLTVLATLGLGAPVRAALTRGLRLSRTETLAWDFVLGSAVAGYAVMAAGHLGRLHPAAAWLMLAAGVALWLPQAARCQPRRFARGHALVSLSALALAWQAWGSLTPEIGGDALNYHLAGPRGWIDAGAITASPLRFHLLLSGHHMMINTWLLLLGGDVLCKLTQTTQFAAALLLIAATGRRLAGRRAGALAACLAVMSISAAWYRAPVMVRSDLTALLFSAAALWSLTVWARSPRPRAALLAGLAAGLAVATKYTAIPFVAAPLAAAMALAGLAVHRLRRGAPASLALLAVSALLAFSPWALRGWIVTGDPLYPLLADVLPLKPGYDEARRGMDEYQRGFAAGSWRHRLRFSVTEGDFLMPLLPLAGAAALFSRRRGPGVLGLFAVLATAAGIATPVAEFGRFFLITAPASAALTAWLFERLARRTSLGAPLIAAMALLAALNLVQHQAVALSQPGNAWRGRPVMSREAALDFLRDGTPGFTHAVAAYRWIEANLPPDARVLCINHPYAYHLPRRHWTRDRWNMEVYDWLLRREGSPDAVTARLRAEGVTHVLRQGEDFAIDPGYWTWEAASAALLWHGGDVWIFALPPQGDGAP